MTYFKKNPNIYKLWQQHQAAHWLSGELCFDVYTDEFNSIPEPLKSVFFRTLAVFTVLDVEVANNYNEEKNFYGKYPDIFAFITDRIARESTHIDAYSQILTLTKHEHLITEVQEFFDSLNYENPFYTTVDVIAYQTIYGILIEGGLLYAFFFLINNLCEQDPAINRFSVANQWSFRDEFLHYAFAKNILEMTRKQYSYVYNNTELIDLLVRYTIRLCGHLFAYIYKDTPDHLQHNYIASLKNLLDLRKSEITGEPHSLDETQLNQLNELIDNFKIDRMQNQFEIISDQYTK